MLAKSVCDFDILLTLFFFLKANRPKIYSHQSKLEEAYLAFLREHINGTLKFIGDHKKVFIFHILESTTLDYDTRKKPLRCMKKDKKCIGI